MMIRLMIADDHALIRAGLVQYLKMSPDIEVVGEAANGKALLDKLGDTPVDLVLLDLVMPGISGNELISSIKSSFPEVHILVLSMINDPKVVTNALKAGASGYICKDCKPQILREAIRKISATGQYLSPDMAEQIVFSNHSAEKKSAKLILSEREMQIFHLIIDGKSIREIAQELAISDKTVSTHKYNLLSKLGLKTVPDLVRYAIQDELFD